MADKNLTELAESVINIDAEEATESEEKNTTKSLLRRSPLPQHVDGNGTGQRFSPPRC